MPYLFVLFFACCATGCSAAPSAPFFPAWDQINPNQTQMRKPEVVYIGSIGSVGKKVKRGPEPDGCALTDSAGRVDGWSLGCVVSKPVASEFSHD